MSSSNVAYYNENDSFAASWLTNLSDAGHIANGMIDDRSIHNVQPADLDGYRQCHFFAGIGGWSLALRLAGWPDDAEVWTGSCPCQPFSGIGKRKGERDSRHLWPEFARLIRECRPAIVFGEQVAGEDGRDWLAGVRLSLEDMGYEVGGADLCAAGIGAPHIRQRLYWVGYALGSRLEGHAGNGEAGWQTKTARPNTTASVRCDIRPWSKFDPLQCCDGRRRVRPGSFPLANGIPARVGRLRGYGNAIVPQLAAQFIRASVEAIRELETA